MQHRAVVARDRPGDAFHCRNAVDDEAPAALRRRAVAERQAAMLGEVGRPHRRAVLLQVLRVRHHHASALPDLHPHELAVGLLAETDRAVESFGDEVGDAVRQFQGQRELRMLGGEARDEGRDVHAPEPRRRRDTEMAGRLLAPCRHRALGVFQFAQDALAVLQERGALGSQRKAAGGALDQLDAEARLERVEAASDHGRSQPLVTGGGAQAAALSDVHEGGDFLERVHAGGRAINASG